MSEKAPTFHFFFPCFRIVLRNFDLVVPASPRLTSAILAASRQRNLCCGNVAFT